MSEVAIRVENLSKLYHIGTKKSGSFRETISGLLKKNNNLDNKGTEFWALNDVSFEIKRGEAVGIIGKNGAGKSTLLKLLSRITEPTSGRIEINGRVSSLLEVGTGFHPELTGRENIFLNGTILGMTRREVKSKFDEIVDFSGVEKFIDTPVKHYSSGMYVRLAFAVAAHLEPEILIIDEVLAVGDAEFQKKCLGKMEDVSKGQGRTVLFVSHNMSAVRSLCNKGVMLKGGEVILSGNVEDVIGLYLSKEVRDNLNLDWTNLSDPPGNDIISLRKASINYDRNFFKDYITVETPLKVEFEFFIKEDINSFNLSLHLNKVSGEIIFNTASKAVKISKGVFKFTCDIPGNLLNDDNYSIDIFFVKSSANILYKYSEILAFEVKDKPRESLWHGKFKGAVRPLLRWDILEVKQS